MDQNKEFVLVSTTVESEADADRLAGLIVERRLAACVQRLQIHSTYRWKGNMERSPELLLLAKTRASLVDELMRAISEAHTYEVPEIVVIPLAGGLPAYLRWIVEETKEPGDG